MSFTCHLACLSIINVSTDMIIGKVSVAEAAHHSHTSHNMQDKYTGLAEASFVIRSQMNK